MRVDVPDLLLPRGAPLADAWADVAEAVAERLRETVPVRTGALRASVQGSPSPTQEGVQVSALFYAWFLDVELDAEAVDEVVEKALDNWLERP